MNDLSGQIIRGYELRESIGEGGFGAVYRAFQPIVERDVAIKVILPEYADHPDFIRRFESEAQLIARLEHPYIVPLYDYWREPGGAYLVMRSLRTNLRASLREGVWAPQATSRLLDQIGSALTAAHRRGIIHRDIKPDNILLDEDNNAYLADFGIATSPGAPAESTEEQAITGSLAYITPEQLKSEPLSAQTDLYSLGIVLYEMLTGQKPYPESLTLTELIDRQLETPLPPLSTAREGLPPTLDPVLRRATAKNPAQRYADALSLASAFRQALGLETEPARSEQDSTPDFEPENPYKGLRAFQEADASDFNGRTALIDRLLERLAEPGENSRFLALIGPSGSGKSSVIRAGLIPALRRDALPGSKRWFVVDMLPGPHPLDDLKAALLRIAVDQPQTVFHRFGEDQHALSEAINAVLPPDQAIELVLVIDQFEEVFTLVESEAERALFLDSLQAAICDPVSRVRVIISLRADFMYRPLQYARFGELIRQRNEFILPLSPDALKDAIICPAERMGVTPENDLIEAILQDVQGQPGTLPLLQYALTELFERRSGHALTLKAYRETGGVLGALVRRAEELYSALDAGGQEAARQLFMRLVTLGEGTEDTRRRVSRAELMSLVGKDKLIDLGSVLELFSRYRLLTFDRDAITRDPTVEVAHEALIRTWKRLREWLDNNREELRIHRRLMAAVAEWNNAGHEHSFLASGARLDQFESWSRNTIITLNQEEAEYLRASVAEQAALRAADETRIAKEKATAQLARNFQRITAGLVVAGILAIIAIGVLGVQANEAANEVLRARQMVGVAQTQVAETAPTLTAVSKRVEESTTTVELLRLTTEANKLLLANNGNVETAALLSIRALKIAYLAPADTALMQAIEHEYTVRVLPQTDAVYAIAYSPDGKYILVGSKDTTAQLFDARTGQSVRKFAGHSGPIYCVTFSPDSRYALTCSKDETARLWDVESGKLLRTFSRQVTPFYSPGHNGPIYSAAFSPDGKYLLTGSRDKTARLWDVQTGLSVQSFIGSVEGIFGVAYAPDGKTVLTGSRDALARLWDVQTGKLLRSFSGHTGAVWTVAYSPDGKTILTGSNDNTARLWDTQSGQILRVFRGHTTDIQSVAFSPDGKEALTSSADTTARLWDIESGQALRVFTGHPAAIWTAAFSPDGKSVVTGSDDNTVRIWDAQIGNNPFTFAQHPSAVWTVTTSPDGKYVLTGSDDHTARLWDAQSGQMIRRFEGHTSAVYIGAFSPDGKYVLTGANDYTARIWDIQTGKTIQTFNTPLDPIYGAAFSADGKWIGAGGTDAVLRVWNVQTGESVKNLSGHKGPISSVAFSPDGRYILTGSYDHTARLWDAQTGEALRTFDGHTDTVSSVAFSPDGRYVLTGSADTSARLWATQTGKPEQTFVGHTNAVSGVAFSPDGKTILTGSADTTAHLWDAQSGQSLRIFAGHSSALTAVAFSPDGKSVLTASGDNTVRQWKANYRDFIADACSQVARDFTNEERLRFGLQDNTPTCPKFGPAS